MIKGFARAIVYGNVWIAFGAASLGLAITKLLSGGLIFDPLFFLLFGSTWMTYSAMRLRSVIQKEIAPEGVLLTWVRSHRNLNMLFCVVGAGIALWAAFRLNSTAWVMLGISAAVSLAYVLPLFSVGGIKKEMREISTIKTGLVALVWSITTVGMSWALHGTGGFPWLLFAGVFFLIQGLTVPFDIRDLFFDEQVGLKTIANRQGVKTAKSLSVVLLILGITCFVIYLYDEGAGLLHLFLGLWLLLSVFVVITTNKDKPEWWYTFLLDGTIVIFAWGFILCLSQ